MGRVFAFPADPAKGEIDARGCRVFTHRNTKIPLVCRVELDDDADEGMATVTNYATDSGGTVLVDYQQGAACRTVFRTWVRVVREGAPDPDPAAGEKIVLWNGPGGRIVAAPDPVPNIPFANKQG